MAQGCTGRGQPAVGSSPASPGSALGGCVWVGPEQLGDPLPLWGLAPMVARHPPGPSLQHCAEQGGPLGPKETHRPAWTLHSGLRVRDTVWARQEAGTLGCWDPPPGADSGRSGLVQDDRHHTGLVWGWALPGQQGDSQSMGRALQGCVGPGMLWLGPGAGHGPTVPPSLWLPQGEGPWGPGGWHWGEGHSLVKGGEMGASCSFTPLHVPLGTF